MKYIYIAFLSLVLIGEANAQCDPTDCASFSNLIPDANEIMAPTIPLVEINFAGFPAGPITLDQINDAFPNSSLLEINSYPRAGTGNYDFQNDGNALNSDQNGDLVVIPNFGTFTNVDSMSFSLRELTTEFGFMIGDWAGPFNVLLYNGSTFIDQVQVSTLNGPLTNYIQNDVPFNRVVLTALPDNGPANWVVIRLFVPVYVAPIPTIGQWGLIVLSLMVFIAGVGYFKYSRTNVIVQR